MIPTNIVSTSDTAVTTSMGTSDNYVNAIMKLITGSPILLVCVLIAYVIGHLWTYVILTYFSKKGQSILSSKYGKFGLGITWLAIISIPYHSIVYGDMNVSLETLTTIWIPVLIIALAIQFAIIIIVNIIHKKG